MTNNIAKIRAALEAAKTTARICVLPGLAQETEVALAALAELEKAAQTPAPVAEIREPTPEECERIAHTATMTMHADVTFAKIGRAMFRAVRAVMWPKSEGL